MTQLGLEEWPPLSATWGRWTLAAALGVLTAISVVLEVWLVGWGIADVVSRFPETAHLSVHGMVWVVATATMSQIATVSLLVGALRGSIAHPRTPRWAVVANYSTAAFVVLVATGFVVLSSAGFLSAGAFLCLTVAAVASLIYLAVSLIYWSSRR